MNENNNNNKPLLPLLEGNLFKLKHKPSLISSWTKRYFKTNNNNNTIEYYDTIEQSKIINNKPIKSFEFNLFDNNVNIITLSDTMFEIIFNGDVDLVLIFNTNSLEERNYWFLPLNKYLYELKEYIILERQKLRLPLLTPLENSFNKLKSNPNTFGTFTRRYFILNKNNNNKLEYLDRNPIDNEGKQITGVNVKKSYNIEDISSINTIDRWTLQIIFKSNNNNNKDIILTLRADTVQIFSLWYETISKFLKQKVIYNKLCLENPELLNPPKNENKPTIAIATNVTIEPIETSVAIVLDSNILNENKLIDNNNGYPVPTAPLINEENKVIEIITK